MKFPKPFGYCTRQITKPHPDITTRRAREVFPAYLSQLFWDVG